VTENLFIQKNAPALVLAPMEGVTDAPMRQLLGELGGFDFCVSEFLRISQDVQPPRTFLEHVPEFINGCKTLSGLPVQFQLLGGSPERMALGALRAVELGALAIDINFGCPAPTVNKNDGGATLLKFPERVESIVRAIRDAVPNHIPVSAKLRLGWDDIRSIHVNAARAARGGASWITIHGRTKTQGYTPPAYWAPIGEVRKALDIPVIANGEIWTVDDFKRCQDQTGCEHYMLGRGALVDPLLAFKIRRLLGRESKQASFTFAQMSFMTEQDWNRILSRFAEICRTHTNNEAYTVRRIKQWLKMVHTHSHFPGFDFIKTTLTVKDLFSKVSEYAPCSGLH